MNTQRNVAALVRPSLSDGLSWSRNPFRNQCTVCLPPLQTPEGVAGGGSNTSGAWLRVFDAGNVSAADDILT